MLYYKPMIIILSLNFPNNFKIIIYIHTIIYKPIGDGNISNQNLQIFGDKLSINLVAFNIANLFKNGACFAFIKAGRLKCLTNYKLQAVI